MKFRKNWKRFWTLDRHHAEGFTLVELIVVIAILAILAGVGTVGYSGYVKKANIAADEALFAEIETAIHLAYYANPDTSYDGCIVLSGTDDAESQASGALDSAMKDAFGSDWASRTKVLCSDWSSAAYVDSSFKGHETALLGVVEDLTETLETLIGNNNSLVGANFSNFLTDLNVDAEDTGAVADAAVLYVARDSSDMSEAQRQNVINAMAGMLTSSDAIADINTAMGGNKVVAACAAYYAIVEGYCRYADSKGYGDALDALETANFGENPEDAKNAVNAKVNAVMAVIEEEKMENGSFKAGTYVEEYFATGGQAEKDAEAYLDMLVMVNNAQSDILNSGSLGNDNFYDKEGGELEKMFLLVANGGAMVLVKEVDGKLVVTLPSRDK